MPHISTNDDRSAYSWPDGASDGGSEGCGCAGGPDGRFSKHKRHLSRVCLLAEVFLSSFSGICAWGCQWMFQRLACSFAADPAFFLLSQLTLRGYSIGVEQQEMEPCLMH